MWVAIDDVGIFFFFQRKTGYGVRLGFGGAENVIKDSDKGASRLKLETGRRRGIRTHDPLGVNEVL